MNPPIISIRARAIRHRRDEDESLAGFFSHIGELYNVHHFWGKCKKGIYFDWTVELPYCPMAWLLHFHHFILDFRGDTVWIKKKPSKGFPGKYLSYEKFAAGGCLYKS